MSWNFIIPGFFIFVAQGPDLFQGFFVAQIKKGAMGLDDQKYMRMALKEAVKGGGYVNPNPLVGAVIVKEGQVIGKGYHEAFGGPHAERQAFAHCVGDLAGATLYVTLEPCCHRGKTPPCTAVIIEKKIGRVVVGSRDPNPIVDGGGITALEQQGIPVTSGVLEKECDAINRPFFYYITHKMPWVMLKYAMTADGKIATATGASRWISGEASRQAGQTLRSRLAGIMVGIGTILADDPLLTCRIAGAKSPVRIICDSHLRTPLNAQVVLSAHQNPTVIATILEASCERAKALQAAGCQVLTVGEGPGGIDLKALMHILGEQGIDSILLEGGATLNESALAAGIVQSVRTYIAPKIFGGETAKTPVGGSGVAQPDQAYVLKNGQMTQVGEDYRIDWEVMACSPGL
jgi:diaminohydroxyphosphoribosylaminopyrimidine deaminase/5-amino-6-(5-phosphoribosylamino)uracil reductase